METRPRTRFLFWYTAWTILVYVLLLGFIGVQAYVRWKINQNFSFLPGAGFETIAAIAFGQLVGLVYLWTREK